MTVAMAAPLSAQSSRWVSASSGADPLIEIDTTTSAAHDGHEDYWIRVNYSKPRELSVSTKGSASEKPKLYSVHIGLWAVDCAKKTYQVTQSIYRSSDGDVIYSDQDQKEYPSAWHSPVPESIGEVAVNYACAQHGALLAGRRATPTPAWAGMADRWTLISVTDNTAIGVDTTRAQVEKDWTRPIFTVWAQIRFRLPQMFALYPVGKTVNRIMVDCASGKMRVEGLVALYADNGRLLTSSNQSTEWKKPDPESTSSATVAGACRVLSGR